MYIFGFNFGITKFYIHKYNSARTFSPKSIPNNILIKYKKLLNRKVYKLLKKQKFEWGIFFFSKCTYYILTGKNKYLRTH